MIHKILSSVTFGDIVLVLTFIVTISGVIEKLFNKKFIGTWLLSGIKKFFLFPFKTLKELEKIKETNEQLIEEVKNVKTEVQFNGGKYKLRDAVADIKQTTETILNNQAFTNEKQKAMMYIDSNPIFISNRDNDVIFVNAAGVS